MENKIVSRLIWGLSSLIILVLVFINLMMMAPVQAQEDDLNFAPDQETSDVISAPTESVWIPTTRDTFVASNTPNTNYGSSSFIRFGMTPNSLGAERPMLYFNLRPYLPAGATITKAEFHVYLLSINPSGDCGRGYAANYINQSWNEGSVTWNNMPQWGSEFARGDLACSPGWQVTNVTNLAKRWQDNPSSNNGVILIGDERPDQTHERIYYSRNANNNLYPRLYVEYSNYKDTTAPVVKVTEPSPAGVWSSANFIVKWQGYDPNNPDGTAGSGIRWYDVYYSLDTGYNWKIGRAQVTSTETRAIGAQHLQRYDFYARAQDNAGNEGPAPTNPNFTQTWTRIDAEPPEVSMNPLPEFTSTTSFPVSWGDTKEGRESGIANYDVQWREAGGAWTILLYGTTATSTTFTNGQSGQTYEFRARGTDNVGNVQEWGGPQAGQLFGQYRWQKFCLLNRQFTNKLVDQSLATISWSSGKD